MPTEHPQEKGRTPSPLQEPEPQEQAKPLTHAVLPITP